MHLAGNYPPKWADKRSLKQTRHLVIEKPGLYVMDHDQVKLMDKIGYLMDIFVVPYF